MDCLDYGPGDLLGDHGMDDPMALNQGMRRITSTHAIERAALEAAVADGVSVAGSIKSEGKSKKAGLRRGKWTTEEENYANRLIQEFKSGLLPLTDGTTLRTFLSKLLNCDPMRISKKFVGQNCIGKQVFRRRQQDLEKLSADQIERSRRELAELERRFLERVAQTNRSRNAPKDGTGIKMSGYLEDGLSIGLVTGPGGQALAPWMLPPEDLQPVDPGGYSMIGVNGSGGGNSMSTMTIGRGDIVLREMAAMHGSSHNHLQHQRQHPGNNPMQYMSHHQHQESMYPSHMTNNGNNNNNSGFHGPNGHSSSGYISNMQSHNMNSHQMYGAGGVQSSQNVESIQQSYSRHGSSSDGYSNNDGSYSHQSYSSNSSLKNQNMSSLHSLGGEDNSSRFGHSKNSRNIGESNVVDSNISLNGYTDSNGNLYSNTSASGSLSSIPHSASLEMLNALGVDDLRVFPTSQSIENLQGLYSSGSAIWGSSNSLGYSWPSMPNFDVGVGIDLSTLERKDSNNASDSTSKSSGSSALYSSSFEASEKPENSNVDSTVSSSSSTSKASNEMSAANAYSSTALKLSSAFYSNYHVSAPSAATASTLRIENLDSNERSSSDQLQANNNDFQHDKHFAINQQQQDGQSKVSANKSHSSLTSSVSDADSYTNTLPNSIDQKKTLDISHENSSSDSSTNIEDEKNSSGLSPQKRLQSDGGIRNNFVTNLVSSPYSNCPHEVMTMVLGGLDSPVINPIEASTSNSVSSVGNCSEQDNSGVDSVESTHEKSRKDVGHNTDNFAEENKSLSSGQKNDNKGLGVTRNSSIDNFWMLVNMGDLPKPEVNVLSESLFSKDGERSTTLATASDSATSVNSALSSSLPSQYDSSSIISQNTESRKSNDSSPLAAKSEVNSSTDVSGEHCAQNNDAALAEKRKVSSIYSEDEMNTTNQRGCRDDRTASLQS